MTDELKDENGHPLQEGFYLRQDCIMGTHSVQNIVYISQRGDQYYQESLSVAIVPLQVSDKTTFRLFPQKDLDWLKRRISQLEIIADTQASLFRQDYEPDNFWG